jgi:hypothetical protein
LGAPIGHHVCNPWALHPGQAGRGMGIPETLTIWNRVLNPAAAGMTGSSQGVGVKTGHADCN